MRASAEHVQARGGRKVIGPTSRKPARSGGPSRSVAWYSPTQAKSGLEWATFE